MLNGVPEGFTRIVVLSLFEENDAQQLLEVGGPRILSHGGLRLRKRRIQAAGLNLRRDLVGK
jgi:hypothetical protein